MNDLKFLKKIYFLILSVLLSGSICVAADDEELSLNEVEAYQKLEVMMRVVHLLRKDYVNEDMVQIEDLIDNAMNGMMSSLDPFSSFMAAEQFKNMMDNTEGKFGGLGIIITVRDEAITIVAPIKGTPGSRAGLKSGDKIIRVDGVEVGRKDMINSSKIFRGAPGSKVTLTIYRPSEDRKFDVDLVREMIPVETVVDVKVEDNIGYLHITQFGEPTVDMVHKAVEGFEKENVEGIIIDVRDNPGGLLKSAVGICDIFLDKGKLVVFTEGRNDVVRKKYYSNHKPVSAKTPVAILINGGSASASEIVAGCLQDYGRAVLIGENSFGKGSVQNIFELPDGNALRMTVAHSFPPGKRMIHGKGIKPNVEINLSPEEEKLKMEWEYALESEKKAMKPYVDRQLLRAKDTLKSYNIYKKSLGDIPGDAKLNEEEKDTNK